MVRQTLGDRIPGGGLVVGEIKRGRGGFMHWVCVEAAAAMG
jgi:hypothetical protein